MGAVITFCAAGLTHYAVVLRHCADDRRLACKFLLSLASLSFVGVTVLVIISRCNRRVLLDYCPLLFWFFESVGLSSMAVFPMLWYREYFFDASEGMSFREEDFFDANEGAVQTPSSARRGP